MSGIIEDLRSRKVETRANRRNDRDLAQYSAALFLWSKPITELLHTLYGTPAQYAADARPRAFKDLLAAVARQQTDGTLRWTDLMGGNGNAQDEYFNAARQGALGTVAVQAVVLTTVDLFGRGEKPDASAPATLPSPPADTLVTDGANQLRFLIADATSVQLGERQNLITMITGPEYLDDPAAGLVNAYNQVAEGGLLLVSAADTWGKFMGESSHGHLSAAHQFIDMLKTSGVPFSTEMGQYHTSIFNALAIQRLPGTEMVQTEAPSLVYGRTSYPQDRSPIEIVPAGARQP